MSHSLSRLFVPLALVCGVLASTATAQNPVSGKFAAPEQLTAGGEALTGIRYPSPTLHDLDGDGQRELLIGDLMGNIKVAQREQGKNDLDWSKLEFLQTSEKEPLKLNNW